VLKEGCTVEEIDSKEERAPVSRRDLVLNALTGLVFIGSLIGIANGVVRFLYPPGRALGAGERSEIGKVDDILEGEGKKVQVGGTAVWVIHTKEGFRAYNAKCTHLGCIVEWKKEQSTFLCPCHAAVFDANGNVVSGPAPKPLGEIKVQISGNKILAGGAA